MSTSAVRTSCTCGAPLIAVLAGERTRPSRRSRPPMVAWSAHGRPVAACPNCRKKLARISVDRFKELIAGQAEIQEASP